MEKLDVKQIVSRLEGFYENIKLEERLDSDPYKVLVRTILSQNTSDNNTRKAIQILEKKFLIDPHVLLEVPDNEIVDAIRVSGLQQIKTARIKAATKEIIEKWNGNLKEMVSNNSTEAARKELYNLPGVGRKTADCVLLFGFNKDVIPVDTHVFRVSKRLGLAPGNANYDQVSDFLDEILPSGKKGITHLLLIQLGREICTARKARCNICPLDDLCPKIGVETNNKQRKKKKRK